MQPQYDMGMKWWTGGIFVSHTVLSKWSSCSLNSHQLNALLSTYTSISLNIYIYIHNAWLKSDMRV